MGVQFASPLCDGTWKIGSQSTPVDASHRLRYVAVALNILRHAQGTFPYNFSLKEPSDVDQHDALGGPLIPSRVPPSSSVHETLEAKEKQGETRAQVAQQAAFENLLMAGHGLTSQIAFDLLFDAMTNSIVQEIGSEQNLKQTQEKHSRQPVVFVELRECCLLATDRDAPSRLSSQRSMHARCECWRSNS